MDIKEFLASFKPGFDPVPISEKLRSGLIALVSVLLLGFALHALSNGGFPLIMLSSMAAAAVLLYAVPHSPMAQPWPLVGGNLVAGLVGWICSLYIPDPIIATACAAGLAISAMHLAHCLHPPGAATAVVMVLNAPQLHQHGWQWAATSLVVNVLLSLLLALVLNNLVPGRHYPVRRGVTKPTGISCELKPEDIEWALTQMDGVIDVTEEDLIDIYRMAAGRAKARVAK